MENIKNLLSQLVKSEGFKKEASVLKALLKDSVWWMAEETDKAAITGVDKAKPYFCQKGEAVTDACLRRFRNLLNKTRISKKPVRFGCANSKNGICVPVMQGDRIYGYIGICHSQNKIKDDIIALFSNFMEGLIREFQKEVELAKLYEAVRPRAIALSTVHTIHRILSSTLNLEELLPKIARLSLQILKAERCCILLANGNKKPTIVHISASNNGKKGSGLYHGHYARIIKRDVLRRGKLVMTKKMLCAPLTDEDVMGAICVMCRADNAPFNIFDKEILATLSEQAVIAVKNAKLYKEQEDITLGSIKSLATTLATRTGGSYRAKESFIKIILAMGKEMQLGSDELRNLHYAALLHDAGQIGFSDKILTKSAKLTGREYDIIKKHPKKSVKIIKHLSFLKPVIPLILHHHENYDGSGYPDGLKGDNIPLGSRIMALAGAFNAMITKRPYRQKVDIEKAISEIKKSSGTQFDPRAVKAFLKIIEKKSVVDLLKKNR
ncbi:MAG: HD domain-containing phosphohydrolase [Candidatus Omnitrophota bacterium]